MKVDGGISGDLRRAPQAAKALEQFGYDGCWTGEINHDPFLPLLLAAEHTSQGLSHRLRASRHEHTSRVASIGSRRWPRRR